MRQILRDRTRRHVGVGRAQVEVVMTPEGDTKLARQRSRSDITDPAEFKQRFGFERIADRQLQAALDVLKGMRLLGERAAAPASSAQ